MFLCVLQIRERRKQAYKQVYKAMVETEMRELRCPCLSSFSDIFPPFFSFTKQYFWNTCYVLDIILGAGGMSVNKTGKATAFMELNF